jgi:RNA polymerase sigma factor (sigma-70 family)
MGKSEAEARRGSSSSADTTSFDAFYRTSRTEVTRALTLAIGARDLAAEAVDEAFARAFERWPDVREYENPAGWVFRVGLNWARSRLRRRSNRVGVLMDEGHHIDELPEPELLEAVEQLPFQYRSVVVARFFLDWSIEETARALDLPEGTVKTRQSRALKRLHKKLGGST